MSNEVITVRIGAVNASVTEIALAVGSQTLADALEVSGLRSKFDSGMKAVSASQTLELGSSLQNNALVMLTPSRVKGN